MDSEVKVDTRRWAEGRIADNHRWSETLYSLKVEADIEPFQAGQFGRLGMVIGEKLIARPYSFVNAPDERPLEFYSIVVPGGPLSPRMAKLQPGERIWVARRGGGFFTLAEVPEEGDDLWLLSTGTALGPFLSILKTDEPWQRFSRVVLVHAVRTAAELTYRDQIERFGAEHPGQFTMVPFVSREQHPGAMPGRITNAIREGTLEERTGVELAPGRSQVMLCGNPDMVKDTTALLVDRGFKENRRKDPGNITTERYW